MNQILHSRCRHWLSALLLAASTLIPAWAAQAPPPSPQLGNQPSLAGELSAPTLELKTVTLAGAGFGDEGTAPAKTYSRDIQVTVQTGIVTATHAQVAETTEFLGRWRPFPTGGKLEHRLSAGEGSKTVYVRLMREGTPQQTTPWKSAQITLHVPPAIGNFNIDNGAAQTSDHGVQLGWTINGTATHYRVHTQAAMGSVAWQALTPASMGGIPYTLASGPGGPRPLFLQVRRDLSAPAAASASIQLVCIGPNGKVCSGNGTCVNGQCVCSALDHSGSFCETVCQRCYGAIGNNCGVADGFNFGLCVGNLCMINAGSWTHDECCIAQRRNGPAPQSQQGSCSPAPFGPPPHVCQAEFNKAAAHAADPGLTWTRTVNTSAQRCTTTTMSVDHSAMCNPSGGTLSCGDQRMCCSRSARPTARPGVCRCD
ncbi:MAG: hypothetical protein U5L05_03050 [Rubrivivax sp.]|nr:hypothetical protein [Rubrivivax sp.]